MNSGNQPIKITTYGDYSPGIVHGNFVVNQNIVKLADATPLRHWRGLDEVNYHAPDDGLDRRNKYIQQLVLHLHMAFKGHRFVQFVSLLKLATLEVDGTLTPVYSLVSQYAKFTGSLRKSWNLLWDHDVPMTKKMKHIKQLEREMSRLESWTISLRLPFQQTPTPCEFTYDSEAGRISIAPATSLSTTPADYPHMVKTTSELFVFLFSISESLLVYLGDIEVIHSHYPLFKLFRSLLDHNEYRLTNIKVNMQDPEEWDYINPEVDQEVQELKKRQNSRR